MTNPKLKAHCEDVIANPQEHPEIVLAMAKALLPCLEAEPKIHAWDVPVIPGSKMTRTEVCAPSSEGSYPLYTAPPQPGLKLPDPIKWKEAQSLLNVNQCGEDRFEAFRMGANWQLDEIKRLNGVKS